MSAEPAPRLLRLIFQARYKPKLCHFALADQAAAEFEPDYADWRRGGGGITMSDYTHRCMMAIHHDSFSYCQDLADMNLADARLQRILQKLPSVLGLRGYTRLGLREFVLVPADMVFESLVAVMTAKLYVDARVLRKALPDRTEDLLYRIDGSEGETRFHVTIAPVKRDEVDPKIMDLANAATVDPSRLHETLKEAQESLPAVGVFFDVDFYRESDTERIGLESASAFTKSARDRIGRMVDEMMGYLLERT